MNGAEVGVLEKTNEVSLRSLLKGQNGRGLESGLRSDFVGDFLNESLEGEFSDQKFSALLISSDFSSGNGTGSESVGFLDTASGGGGFLGGLG